MKKLFWLMMALCGTMSSLAQPVITQQPTNQMVLNGSSAVLTVQVSGTGPFTYQWYFNTNTIDGGTNAVLPVVSVDSSQTGSYFCVITDAYGSITSRVVSLTIGLPPVITLQPIAQTNINGTTVIFTTSVSGAGPFTYQWQFNGTNLPNNIITTVAGNGTNGFSGDGGLAVNAKLNAPNGAVVDAAGNLFIAVGNRIREVITNGIISTIAGGGHTYPGDGDLATNAVLMNAVGIAIDGVGNVLVADIGRGFSARIRKIDTNGIITTVAGGGTNYPSGIMATNARMDASDVAVDSAGDLFIAGYTTINSPYGNTVYKVDASGMMTIVAGKLNQAPSYSGDGGAATNANLARPQAVALDTSGNLFIVDTDNNRFRKVDTNGIITTVAGNGIYAYSGDGGLATNASLQGIGGVAVDAHGNLFLSDVNRIRQVDTNGIIITVAGNGISGYSGDGGAATNASLKGPQRVSVDAAGNLFIADTFNNRIREVALAGSPTLALNNVTVNNAGSYSVIITSPYGTVTSSNAVLTVIVLPSISAALAVDGSCLLSWSAQSNFTYQLQYTTNLVAPAWQSLGSPITATNGTVSASDIPGADLQRFYRVQLVH